ncbi:hypothetical protein KI387_033766, partial [Taxus chinensis]
GTSDIARVKAGLPSASKFSDAVSKHVKIIANQILAYYKDKKSTTETVWNDVQNVHWARAGFLLVATAIQRLESLNISNKVGCLEVLNSMNNLAKEINNWTKKTNDLILKSEIIDLEMEKTVMKSTCLIGSGAILILYLQKRRKTLKSSQNVSKDRRELAKIFLLMDKMWSKMLYLQKRHYIKNDLQSGASDPVGIEQQITKVTELLEWENENPAVSVIVYGMEGAGKTTLADAVYARLNLQGWKYSKVTLTEKKETEPQIEELQSQILDDFNRTKTSSILFESDEQDLKAVMEKETVFIYIDSILRKEHLEKLLPMNITSPKKFRMLLTARNRNVCSVIEKCGIKPCKIYPIESLPLDAALHILSRRMDTDSILNQSHEQANEIAKHCSCSPLFLQVIGDYLGQQNDKIKAYDRVVDWLQGGEAFSEDKEHIFNIFNLLSAYDDSNVHEAFLDICSYFHDWEWEKVACIVGKEELESLEDGNLIQRIIKADTCTRKEERLSIHGLLLAAGRNASKQNRFTSVEEISLALEKDEVLRQTKGVWLKGRNYKSPIHISTENLYAMSKSLRVFAIEDLTILQGKCNGQFEELRFLQVNGRAPDLPIDILQPMQLRELNVLSSIQKFPESIGKLQHLQTIVVDGRPNTSLKALPEEFCHLHSLKRLTLRWCMIFTSLPTHFASLTNLQHLELAFCSELKELPCSFKHLLKLQNLDLQGCINLAIPPYFLGKITTLQYLNFQDCKKLEVLPTQVPFQASLRSLNLVGKSIEELPNEMGLLTNMETLQVGSPFLKSLPVSLGFMSDLRTLNIEFCTSLTHLPDSLGLLQHLSVNAPQVLKEAAKENIELRNQGEERLQI